MGEVGKRGKEDAEVERQKHESGCYELRQKTGLDGIGKWLFGFAQVHVERDKHVGIESGVRQSLWNRRK